MLYWLSLPPAAMSNGALAAVEARLNEPVRPAAVGITPTVPETEVSWAAEIRASLPLRKLEVDRSFRPIAAYRTSL